MVPSFGCFTASPISLCERISLGDASGLCCTIELGVGYHWADEGGLAHRGFDYASVEGDDNFTEDYTYTN